MCIPEDISLNLDISSLLNAIAKNDSVGSWAIHHRAGPTCRGTWSSRGFHDCFGDCMLCSCISMGKFNGFPFDLRSGDNKLFEMLSVEARCEMVLSPGWPGHALSHLEVWEEWLK